MARVTATTENAMIGATGAFVAGTTYYLALFTADPTTVGTSGEVTGGSYARQAVVFAAAAGGSMASNAGQTFTNMPACGSGTPFFGIFATVGGADYKGGGATTGLGSAISAGSTVTFASGQVTVAVS